MSRVKDLKYLVGRTRALARPDGKKAQPNQDEMYELLVKKLSAQREELKSRERLDSVTDDVKILANRYNDELSELSWLRQQHENDLQEIDYLRKALAKLEIESKQEAQDLSRQMEQLAAEATANLDNLRLEKDQSQQTLSQALAESISERDDAIAELASLKERRNQELLKHGHMLHESQQDAEKLSQQCEELRASANSSKAKVLETQEALTAARRDWAKKEAAFLADLGSIRSELQACQSCLQSEQTVHVETVKALETRNAELARQLEATESQQRGAIEQLKETIRHSEIQTGGVSESVARLESLSSQLQRDLDEKSRLLSTQDAEFREVRRRLGDQITLVQDISEEKSRLERELQATKNQMSSLTSELQTLTQTTTTVKETKQKTDGITRRTSISKCEGENQPSVQFNYFSAHGMEVLEQTLKTTEEKSFKTEMLLRVKTQEADDAIRQLTNIKTEHQELQAQHKKTVVELKTTKETASAAALKADKAKREAVQAQTQIEKLSTQMHNRATVLGEGQIQRLKKELEEQRIQHEKEMHYQSQQHKTALTEANNEAVERLRCVELKAAEEKKRLEAALEKQRLASDKAMTQALQHAESCKKQKGDADKQREVLEQAERSRNIALAEKQKLETQLAELRLSLATHKSDLSCSQEMCASLKCQLAAIQDVQAAYAGAKSELETLKSSCQQLQNQLAARESQISELRTKLAEVAASESQHSSILAERQQHLEQAERLGQRERHVNATVEKLQQTQEAMEGTLTCTGCFGLFEDPVLLMPCGHTCCAKCVTDCCQDCGAKISQKLSNQLLDQLCGKFVFQRQALSGV